jgi:hypothetical protein
VQWSRLLTGILAIDQATTVGWAYISEPGREPLWSHERMAKRGAWEGAIFHAFRAFLLDRIEKLAPIACLAFEAPFLPRPDRSETAVALNPAVSRMGYGFTAHITAVAEECGIRRIEEIQSVEFTKWMTGRGRFAGETAVERKRAKKAAVVAACAARGWQATDDEADALAMLMFTEYRLYPQQALSRRMVLKQPQGPLLEMIL